MQMSSSRTGLLFMVTGMLSLWAGMLFGTIGAFQFVYPDLFEILPFFKSRPLHVSLVVAWIFLAAVGGIYRYVPEYGNVRFYSERLPKWHLGIFVATGLTIIGSYVAGRFGGREYWEFPPILAIPILISWILLAFNYFRTLLPVRNWPVYYWMWATGIIFFFITFMEANAWVIPFVRGNLVRELTLQWKSYGSLVGSWNMLVYGTSIFLMERMGGSQTVSRSRISFLLYFLGFTNLLFGWAHHTYILPAAPWIRVVAYSISMSELIILARIIWQWRSTVAQAKLNYHRIPYMFMMAAEFWILVNLILALLISVPAINVYTHGTHITVAHAMGSTIGINTMILLSSIFFVLRPPADERPERPRTVITGFWVANISLTVFFTCLVIAGIIKGRLSMVEGLPHQVIMDRITPYLIGFGTAGIALLIGLSLVLWNAITDMMRLVRKSE